MLARSSIYTNRRDEKCDCVTQYFDYNVTGRRNVETLMTQLIFLIAFICAEKPKFTQTLNVDINSSTTENAHTGTTKYLLLCLDLKYKQ